jgi:hypothetical protein
MQSMDAEAIKRLIHEAAMDPVTECDEVGWSMADHLEGPPPETFDEALAIVRRQMPDESEVVISNTAEALLERVRARRSNQ